MKFLKNTFLIILIYGLIIISHVYWLGWFGEFLEIESNEKKTDLLVVSTGSYERFRYAVDLIKDNFAGKLLILGDSRIVTQIPGKNPLKLAYEEAVELQIPPSMLFIDNSTSTWVDAQVTRSFMETRNIASASVVTDVYNMRRMAMIFNYVFAKTNLRINYISVGLPWNDFKPGRWWKNSFEFEYVVKEWIKLPLDYIRIHLPSSW